MGKAKKRKGSRGSLAPTVSCQLAGQCMYVLSALMQFPSASRLRLMCAPSIILLPRFCVLAARSEPAKSMRNSLPTRTCCWMPATRCRCLTDTMSTACDRDDVRLAAVGSWVRSLLPPFRIDITSTTQSTTDAATRPKLKSPGLVRLVAFGE